MYRLTPAHTQPLAILTCDPNSASLSCALTECFSSFKSGTQLTAQHSLSEAEPTPMPVLDGMARWECRGISERHELTSDTERMLTASLLQPAETRLGHAAE